MKRRLISMMLTLCMVLSMLAPTALAADEQGNLTQASGSEQAECTCTIQQEEGAFIHAPDCPFYTAPKEEKQEEEAPQADVEQILDMLEALPVPETLDGDWRNAPAEDIAAARTVLEELNEGDIDQVPEELLVKLEDLEHIRDTVGDCADLGCPYHYQPEALSEMEEGREETPDALTLSDLVSEYGITPPIQPNAVWEEQHPQTIIIGEDNQNNAHTGEPDGDMDKYLDFRNKKLPIELSFELQEGELPTQSAFVAIKAYDVDEEDGENDFVYLNDDIFLPMDQECDQFSSLFYGKTTYNNENIGYLSGTNGTWNTTVLEIPLEKLRVGTNTISITVAKGWCVEVDWIQVILDGGSKDSSISGFDLTLGTPTGTAQVTVPATVTIEQSGNTVYHTEYTLLNEAGDALDAAFGQASETETVQLTIPKNSEDGEYKVVGLLKDDDENIKAMDTVTFRLKNGVPNFAPILTHTLSPSSLTKQNVTVNVSVDDLMGCEGITIIGPDGNGANYSASQNGEYTFTVNYTWNGQKLTDNYIVKVDNIDKEPPEIKAGDVPSVYEDTTDEEVEAYLKAAVSITDNTKVDENGTVWEGIKGLAASSGQKQVTVTASDMVGNKATETITVTVLPKPLELTMENPEGPDDQTYALKATLKYTGGLTITESGFVWGSMQNPTLSVNNGSAKTSVPVTQKGGTLSATADKIAEGINYYARAYVKTSDGGIYYSDTKTFGIGAPQYGVFSIENNGSNTFTISRAGGNEGAQTVYYRTVSGSAVSGTHFTGVSGKLDFDEGEEKETVTVTEQGASAAFEDKQATQYSNADRIYWLEIYRVDGGATIDSGRSRAQRTMTVDQEHRVDRRIFNDFEKTIAGSSHEHGDNTDDGGLGWAEGKEGTDRETLDITSVLTTPGYWRSLTGAELQYKMQFKAKEIDDGYQHMQVTPGNDRQDISFWPYEGNWDGSPPPANTGGARYACTFEHGGSKRNTTPAQYYLPDSSGSNPDNAEWNERWAKGIDGGKSYIPLPLDEDKVTISYAASGSGSDNWETQNEIHYFRIGDTSEPQLLGVAPVENGYRIGDQITVSLVFDEIVDQKNSAINEAALKIKTSWGDFSYAGGADTNVLYFTGKISDTADGALTINSIEGAEDIRDMCDDEGTSTSSETGNAGGNVDTAVPVITVSEKAIAEDNSKLSAVISSTNATSLQYRWSTETQMPVAWLTGASGEAAATLSADVQEQPAESKTYYLHVLATNKINGSTSYAREAFTLHSGTGGGIPPVYIAPELQVKAEDTPEWTKQSRKILVDWKPADQVVSYTGPNGSTGTVTGDNGSGQLEAEENGIYTFTLKTDDGVLTKQAEVTGIDKVKPEMTIRAPEAEDVYTPVKDGEEQEEVHEPIIYHAITVGGTASDNLSGVEKVEYVFVEQNNAPEGGWTQAVLKDGSYSFTYTAAQEKETKLYLFIRTTDKAGNAVIETAGETPYTVVKEPAPGTTEIPEFSFQDSGSGWTKGPVKLQWNVSAPESGFEVYPSDQPVVRDEPVGEIRAAKNGRYTVGVKVGNGEMIEKSVVVNRIDNEAPWVDISVPEGWAKTKTVEISVTDDQSQQVDATGKVTGYSGSGIASVEWKTEDGEYSKIGADESGGYQFVAQTNGTYMVRTTDNVGNTEEYRVLVDKIDVTAPKITIGDIPDDWQGEEQEIAITAEDNESSIQELKYAIAETKGTPPSDLFTVENGKITIAQNGKWYIYYRAEDRTGNISSGWSEKPVMVDMTTPILSITGGEKGSEELSLKITATNGPSGVSISATHGTESSEPVEGSYKILEAGEYIFKAVSGAGKTAEKKVTVHKITFTCSESSVPSTQLVVNGGQAVKPADPSRAGYKFAGWQKDGTEYEFGTGVTENIELTAKWELTGPEVKLKATPAAETAYTGQPAITLIAEASHLEKGVTYHYEWEKDGIPLENEGSSLELTNVSDSGTYTVTVTVATAAGESAKSSDSIEAVVRPATVSFAIQADETTYNGKPQKPVVTQTVGQTPSVGEDFTVSYEQAGKVVYSPTEAGRYDVMVTLTSKNFAFEGGLDKKNIGSFWINRKPVQVIWRGLEQIYSGQEPENVIGLSGVLPGEDCGLKPIPLQADAGIYPLQAELTGENAENYVLTNPDAVLTIRQAPVAFEVTDNVVQYTGKPVYAKISPSIGGFDKYAITYWDENGNLVAEPSAVGTYTIQAKLTDKNYRHTDAADGAARKIGTLTITEQEARTYSVSYTGEGTEGVPKEEGLAASSVVLLPDAERAGFELTGWVWDGVWYYPGSLFMMPAEDVVFEAQWEPVFQIGGEVVTDETENPIAHVTVTLKLGAEVIAETVTDDKGRFSFDGVSAGIYNLVGSYNGIIMTIQAEIRKDENSITIEMPQGKTNSIVRVAEDAPRLTVGNLETVFTAKEASEELYTVADSRTVQAGGVVEVCMTAKNVSESEAYEAYKQVKRHDQDTNIGLILDLSIEKNVRAQDGTELPEQSIENVKDTGVLLETRIPLTPELQDKDSYTVYRIHESELQTLTEKANSDGERIELADDGRTLIIYARCYSTYMITWKPGHSSNGGGNSSGTTSSRYPIYVETDGSGTADSNKDKAASGETVTITTEGAVESITATADKTGKEIALTDKGNGKYTFKMPSSAVTVKVQFEQKPEIPSVADPDGTGVSSMLNTREHIAYMVGYETGNFGPANNITRAEVAQAFYRLLLDQSHSQSPSFPDVAADAWYHEAVVTLAAKGIITGYEDGTFRPEQPITRSEFAAIAARFARASTDKALTFPDVPADAWYRGAVQTAVSYGWINGYEDGTFRPEQPIGRAETAAIINRMLARIADRSAVDDGAGTRFPDVPASHWAFYDVVEASTEHDYTRDSNTAEESWS